MNAGFLSDMGSLGWCRVVAANGLALRRPQIVAAAANARNRYSPCPPLHARDNAATVARVLPRRRLRTHHGNGIKRTRTAHSAQPGAARRIVQGGALKAPGLRALHLQRQHMQRAHGNAPAAAGTALGVDGRQALRVVEVMARCVVAVCPLQRALHKALRCP